MSPPIRDGSGDSIGSIRLGDGTEISEVRTGAGDVLFSASQINNSAFDHRWAFDEGSGTTLNDAISSSTFNLSSDTSNWVSGTGRGGVYLEFASNEIATNTQSSEWGTKTATYTVWFKPNTTSGGFVFALAGDQSAVTDVGIDTGGGFTGGYSAFVRDADGGSNVTISGPSSASTSAWNFAALQLDFGNQITFYRATAGDTNITKVGSRNYDTDFKTTGDLVYILGARTNESSPRDQYSGDIDHPTASNGRIVSQSDIEQFFDNTKSDYL